ncbi:hypothetical protein G7078_10750 [Sphingomonas sinipercae]|uniref:Uncharacterized protein n=1 Tax=Sphingomonas sinipercae TaxID=2714944 RepID=A0A6G7ZQK1_9SPHN|nr:hypothetical protein [Sphingomonas sinipercae]QIL03208.1 hypothetical protein G7078_10750 [Sphingomonas sinipercae]
MKSVRNAVAVMMVGAFGFATLASAEPAASERKQGTPSSWKYELNGKNRVPKGSRVTNPDGSWREEIRDRNNCVTVKEKTAAGEYKETRHC